MQFEVGDIVDTSRWNESAGVNSKLRNPSKVAEVKNATGRCESGTLLVLEGTSQEFDANWFRPRPVYRPEPPSA